MQMQSVDLAGTAIVLRHLELPQGRLTVGQPINVFRSSPRRRPECQSPTRVLPGHDVKGLSDRAQNSDRKELPVESRSR